MTALPETLFDEEPDTDLERRIRLVVAEIRRQPGWPVDDVKDRILARDLITQFPRLDLPLEITKWRAWMAEFEPKPGKKVNLRVRIVSWCDRVRRGPAGPGSRARGRRTSTAPRPPAEFEQYRSTGLAGWG